MFLKGKRLWEKLLDHIIRITLSKLFPISKAYLCSKTENALIFQLKYGFWKYPRLGRGDGVLFPSLTLTGWLIRSLCGSPFPYLINKHLVFIISGVLCNTSPTIFENMKLELTFL